MTQPQQQADKEWGESTSGNEECSHMLAALANARFTAATTSIQVVNSQGTTISTVEALVDSGAFMSCTPTTAVPHWRSSISTTAAASLCTADGKPMQGVKGSMQVHIKFGDSPQHQVAVRRPNVAPSQIFTSR